MVGDKVGIRILIDIYLVLLGILVGLVIGGFGLVMQCVFVYVGCKFDKGVEWVDYYFDLVYFVFVIQGDVVDGR